MDSASLCQYLVDVVRSDGGKNEKEEITMAVISMKKLLEVGVHFGHQTKRWNPKMAPYIFTSRNGIYIIDLKKSSDKIDEAYKAMMDITAKGGKVLFVGTKKQATEAVAEEATRSGSYYVNSRWLGGTLTNFRTIQKRIKRLIELEKMEEDGSLENYTKKEAILMMILKINQVERPDFLLCICKIFLTLSLFLYCQNKMNMLRYMRCFKYTHHGFSILVPIFGGCC